MIKLPTEMRSSDAKAGQAANIPRMPDEILLNIALNIPGTKKSTALRHLALTHDSFRGVVHEALVRNAVVPNRSITKYIEILSRHMQWAAVITRLTIVGGKGTIRYPEKARASELLACHRFVRKLWTANFFVPALCHRIVVGSTVSSTIHFRTRSIARSRRLVPQPDV